MKRLAIWGIIACVGLLVGSAAVIAAPAGPPDGLDVTVVNPDPISVTGNVNVVNDVSNPVPIEGNVGITDTVNVNVINSTVPEPLQVNLIDFFPGYTVPNDRLLVIKYVSGNFQAGGELLGVYIEISDPEVRHHFVPVFNCVDGTLSRYSFSQQTHIYASPGSEVDIGFGLTGFINSSYFVISGELVPIPATP